MKNGIGKFTEHLEELKKERKIRALAKDQQTRVEDLYVKTHKVGNVELPLISALAWDTLAKVFGDEMKMDLESSRDLGCVVYILEHQKDHEPVINLSKEELLRNGLIRAGEMDYCDKIDYMFNIDEQFMLIKKKSLELMQRKKAKAEMMLKAAGE